MCPPCQRKDGSWVKLDLDAPAVSLVLSPRHASDNQRLLSFLCSRVRGARCGHPTAAGEPAQGVLVLRNGEILAGTTTKVGDRYVVAKSDGSELRDSDSRCGDVLPGPGRGIRSPPPKRFPRGMRQPICSLPTGACGGDCTRARPTSCWPPSPSRRGIPGLEVWSGVCGRLRIRRRYEKPCPLSTHPPPRQDDSERVLSALPSDAVESFASRVQPLLLNRCGSNACHGGRSSTQFQLISPGWGKTITLRYTQRNLLAAYRQVDSAKPEASPLLTIPGRPHGGLESSVFGERDRPQLELLDAWVRKACQAMPAPQPVSVVSPPGELFQSSLRQPIPLPKTTDGSASDPKTGLRPLPSSSGAADAASAALDFRDPFDPERFNRQFLVSPASPATDLSCQRCRNSRLLDSNWGNSHSSSTVSQ